MSTKSLIILAALLGLTACGKSSDSSTTNPPVTATPSPEEPPACEEEPLPPPTLEEDCIELEDPVVDDEYELLALASPMATPVVDMLVAYTPKARIAVGGKDKILALISRGVADTNRAMSDSGVSMQVRLVGTMELKQSETGNYTTDLGALVSKTDSKWNEVHNERARLGADQVSMIGAYTTNTRVAGIGYIRASRDKAFTITKTSAFGYYTFAHEFGHNVGLNHSDGYINTAGLFKTIMAYGNYTRIRRFSNPSIPYNGYRTGNSSHNEASIMNSNAIRMANLMPTVVPNTRPTATPKPNPLPNPCP